jgi:hypothetical protein
MELARIGATEKGGVCRLVGSDLDSDKRTPLVDDPQFYYLQRLMHLCPSHSERSNFRKLLSPNGGECREVKTSDRLNNNGNIDAETLKILVNEIGFSDSLRVGIRWSEQKIEEILINTERDNNADFSGLIKFYKIVETI